MFRLILVMWLSLAAAVASAATCTSVGSGQWKNSNTWSCNREPAAGDSVVIASGNSVSLNGTTNSIAGLTIQSGGSLTDNGNNRVVNLQGNLANNGTVNLSGNGSAIVLRSASTWSGSGTVSVDYLDHNWQTLTLDSAATLAIYLDATDPLLNVGGFNNGSSPNRSATVYLNGGSQRYDDYNLQMPNLSVSGGTKTVSASSLIVLGNLTIDSGASLSTNSVSTVSLGGNLTINGTLSSFSGGSTTWTFNGTSTQSISAAATFRNVTINNSAGLILGGNLTVGDSSWGNLTLTSGKITTGSNSVVIPRNCSGSMITRASGSWIDGNQRLTMPPWNASCVFDVGDSSNYAPITFAYPWHSAPLGGTVTGSTSGGDHPDTTAGTSGINAVKSVNRYWTLTAGSGATFYTYDATFQFCNATGSADCTVNDVDGGATASNFVVAGKISGSWSMLTPTTPASNRRQISGLTGFGAFAIGETGATTIDHYELSVPAASLACLPTTLTVTACADSSSPCTNRQTSVGGQTASLAANSGTLSASTVTFDAQGLANASLSYPAAADGANVVVTLSGESQSAANARKCCPDGANCAVANSCSTTFNTAGFIFSTAANGAEATFGNQVAGDAFGPYWLRAVKSNTTTKACEAAFTSPHPTTLSYQCIDPATCSAGNKLTVGATSVASAGTSMNLSFDANGNASLGSLSYLDVGRIRVNASATVGGTTLTGASKGASGTHFIVKTYSLVLTDIVQTAAPNTVNPGAADATGGRFVRAGESFSATVTSVNSSCAASLASYTQLASIPASCITPNYGKETTAEGATVNHALATGLGLGANPALSNPSAFGSFVAGSATATTLAWDEVGIINLTPAIRDGDYLGAGAASVQSTRTVGRFYPDHFNVVVTPQCGGFVYGGAAAAGQPFTVSAVAMNGKSPSAVTANYQYASAAEPAKNFSRPVNLSLSSGGAVGGLYVGSVAGGTGAIPAANFSGGLGEVRHDAASGRISYGFSTFPSVPTAIAIHAEDADTASGTALLAGADGAVALPGGVRSGRLWLSNAYGSELLRLNVPARLQIWKSTGWETNLLDTCTALTVPTNANSGLTNTLRAKTTASLASPMASGDARLQLATPGAGNTGLVDISGSILRGGNSWLALPVPVARACFGACGPRSPVIYLRESY